MAQSALAGGSRFLARRPGQAFLFHHFGVEQFNHPLDIRVAVGRGVHPPSRLRNLNGISILSRLVRESEDHLNRPTGQPSDHRIQLLASFRLLGERLGEKVALGKLNFQAVWPTNCDTTGLPQSIADIIANFRQDLRPKADSDPG